jgi:hypothetical protein
MKDEEWCGIGVRFVKRVKRPGKEKTTKDWEAEEKNK